MRQCPACGNTYPDDANFCPMDATRLPPAATSGDMEDKPGLGGVTAPMTSVPVHPAVPPNDLSLTMPDGGARLLAGRYLMGPHAHATATGTEAEGTDTQDGGRPVRLKLVPSAMMPVSTMAD